MYKLAKRVFHLHGISRDISNTKGKSVIYVLNQFNKCLQTADKVVGHNISFDKRIIMVESIRNYMRQYFTRDKVFENPNFVL